MTELKQAAKSGRFSVTARVYRATRKSVTIPATKIAVSL